MWHASSQPAAHKFGNISSNSSWVNHAEIPAPGSKVHVSPVAVHFPFGSAIGEATGEVTGEATGEVTGEAVTVEPSGLVSPVPVQWLAQHCSQDDASAISQG